MMAKKAREDVRQKLWEFAARGGLRPRMEKGGILQDLAIVVPTDHCFEADRTYQGEPCDKLCWDIRVINGFDVDRYASKMESSEPLGIADACKRWCMEHHNTAERIRKERGWRYEPIVFTVQGHISPEAQSVIRLIAIAIAQMEDGVDVKAVKEEIMQGISGCLP